MFWPRVGPYPGHIHRPLGSEPAIHPNDPRPRCTKCEQIGHPREQCPARLTLGCDPNSPISVLLQMSQGNVAVMAGQQQQQQHFQQQQQPPIPMYVGKQPLYQAPPSAAPSQPQHLAQVPLHQYPASPASSTASSTSAPSISTNCHRGFTARLAFSGKWAPQKSVLSCPPGREIWIADSGASVHVTCDPSNMFDCVPAEPGNVMIVGGMT